RSRGCTRWTPESATCWPRRSSGAGTSPTCPRFWLRISGSRAVTPSTGIMDRSKCAAILLVAVAASWAVRLNNALTYPSLRAFDGFGHFTYIWFMADHWRVPPPTSGWSFFHPPMYYWLMASIWRLAESLDPLVRLKIGTALTSTLGLAHGLVIYAVVRRRFPDKPLIALLSATLMLFLPVQVFTAG